MNTPKLPKILKASTKEALKPVKVHKKPKTNREYERVSDVLEFLHVISKHEDRIAFTYFDKSRKLHDVTYAELTALVKKIAAGFDSIGLEKSRIAIIGETSVAWIATYLATLADGHVVIPMDKELDMAQIEAFLESVDADVIVYSASFNTKFDNAKATHKSLKHFIAIDPTDAELEGKNTVAFEALLERGEAAVVDKFTRAKHAVLGGADIVIELPTEEVKMWCENVGCKFVPILDKFLFTTIDDLNNRVNKWLDMPDEIDSRHVAEGVVARIDNRSKFTAFKRKGFQFKVLEGIIKDTSDAPDMEEAQELVSEESNEI